MKAQPEGTMLLVIPVPQTFEDGKLLFEQQACHGLEMWSQFFKKVVIATPEIPYAQVENEKDIVWESVDSIPTRDRIEFVQLPWTFRPTGFFGALPQTRQILRGLIQDADYLQFCVGGLFGDWGSIAAQEAHRLGRKYAIHMDWIFHRVILQNLKELKPSPKKYLKQILAWSSRFWNERQIRRASLMLCNGKTVYDYYSKMNDAAYVIHDIHTQEKDWISDDAIAKKMEHVVTADVLNVCYAGRMAAMKAPLDWLKAVAHAKQQGAHIQATWYGDGPLYDHFISERNRLGLEDVVAAPGWIPNRNALLDGVEQSDLFVMTHITDESPRCLIESMIKGTPVVGYDSEYARSLCGPKVIRTCPRGDWRALGDMLVKLSGERKELQQMISSAAVRGKDFSDYKIFEERSELVKRYLDS